MTKRAMEIAPAKSIDRFLPRIGLWLRYGDRESCRVMLSLWVMSMRRGEFLSH